MLGDSDIKEVRYDKYCETCKHWNNGEEIPFCDECLEESMRNGTEVPSKWEKS